MPRGLGGCELIAIPTVTQHPPPSLFLPNPTNYILTQGYSSHSLSYSLSASFISSFHCRHSYELDGPGDLVGSGLACVVRRPETVPLEKKDLVVTSLDLLTNHYQPLDDEELISNLIQLKPFSGQSIKFEVRYSFILLAC